jgi:hypothetical protein
MYFRVKSIFKSNHNHTFKQTKKVGKRTLKSRLCGLGVGARFVTRDI